MNRPSFIDIAAGALLLACTTLANPARAETIVIDFRGKVTDIEDTGGYTIGQVAEGDTFTGRYVYESTAYDDNPLDEVGHYPQMPWLTHTGMQVRLNHVLFRTDPHSNAFYKLNVQVMDDFFGTSPYGTDQYRVISHHNLMPIDVPGGVEHNGHMELSLRDSTLSALTSAELPTTAPDLPPWTSNYFVIYDRGTQPNDFYSISGVVTEAKRCIGRHCTLAPVDVGVPSAQAK